MKLNEGELQTPVFGDDDEQINAAAMAIWADFIKALSTIDKEFLSSEDPKPEVAGALLQGMADEASRRLGTGDEGEEDMDDMEDMGDPDELPDSDVPADVPADGEGGEAPAEEPEGDDFAAEEGLEPDAADLKRFRELAGIPHPKNFV